MVRNGDKVEAHQVCFFRFLGLRLSMLDIRHFLLYPLFSGHFFFAFVSCPFFSLFLFFFFLLNVPRCFL